MKGTEDVAIFWDYENCNAPANASGYLLASNIAALARPYGTIKQFRAYLEITEQPTSPRSTTLRSELQSSGVSLVDCPHNGRKEVADKMLLVDMLAYAIDNPAPATMVIITGDRDFAYALATLKLRRYRVVLITLPHAHASLRCQASVCFDWFSDVVVPANNSPVQTLPSGSSHRHQQRRSSEYAVPKRTSPPPNASGPASASNVGSGTNIDMNWYLQNRKEGQVIRRSPWDDSDRKGLGRERQIEKASTHDESISTSTPRQRTSSVNSQSLPTPLHTQNPTEDSSAFVNRSHQTLESTQTPFLFRGPFDKEVLSPSGFSLPSTPDGSALGCLSPHSTTVGSPPFRSPFGKASERKESAYSSLASTSHQTSLSLPMNLAFLPSSNSAGPNIEKDDMSGTQISMMSSNKAIFDPLIDVLCAHRVKGRSHPLRSAVGLELAKRGNIYGKAGAANFKDYVALAEKEGLVSLGGRDGYAWISLLDCN